MPTLSPIVSQLVKGKTAANIPSVIRQDIFMVLIIFGAELDTLDITAY